MGRFAAVRAWAAAHRHKPRSALNTTAAVFTSFAVAGFAAWMLLRQVGADRYTPFAQLVTATPYVAGACLVPVVVAAGLRRWRLAGAALVVAVALGVAVLPRAVPAVGSPLPADAPTLRVLSVNVELGHADAAAVVELAREENADVLSVQELTPRIADRLAEAGVDEIFQHSSVNPAGGALGTGLWSRYPLGSTGEVSGVTTFRMVTGSIEVGGRRVELVAVHPAPPVPAGIEKWRRDIVALPAAPAVAEGGDQTVRVLAGDFNATLDHSVLRSLIGTGYRDAADDAGDGLRNTWPSDRRVGVAIDHVLAGPVDAVRVLAFRVHHVDRTGHRAVFAELVLA